MAQDEQAHGQAQAPRRKLRESRAFITEAYTIWASLQVRSSARPSSRPPDSRLTWSRLDPQRIVADYEAAAIAEYGAHGSAAAPPPEQVQYYARVCRLYRDTVLKQLPLIHVRSPVKRSLM